MIVLDSSAVIDLLEGGHVGEELKRHLINEAIAISVITVNEVGIGLHGEETSIFDAFLQSVHTLPFDLDVAKKSIVLERKLEKRGHLIGKLDVFIAATCLVHNLQLLTLDQDFREVIDLQLIDLKA